MSQEGNYYENTQEKNESFMRTKRYLDIIRMPNQIMMNIGHFKHKYIYKFKKIFFSCQINNSTNKLIFEKTLC